MGYWNSRGLRGSVLEEMINLTNEQYDKRGVALIQKIPTPVTPVEFDPSSRMIRLAYFDQKSTVDYVGVMRGIPLCFDAKETGKKNLPLGNIHPHQVTYMEKFAAQGGLSFLIVHFTEGNDYFLLPLETLRHYFYETEATGRRSIPFSAFEERYRIEAPEGGFFNYLKIAYLYYEDRGGARKQCGAGKDGE